MSDEVIALVYNFLAQKDASLAEIFKRGFSPNLECVSSLPPLEELVRLFIKSKKKNASPTTSASNEKIQSMMKTKIDLSDFLEKIVLRRAKENSETTSESESEKELEISESSSDSDIVVSAPKRKCLEGGHKKVFQQKSKKQKTKK